MKRRTKNRRKPLTRSEMMSRIKGRDTRIEIALRKALWARGMRYRKEFRIKGARPDIAFPKRKIAIFVDGCFWHGCPKHFVMPRTRSDFWADKLRQNISRDRDQTLELETAGWLVLRFWEHELKEDVEAVAHFIGQALSGERPQSQASDWRVVQVTPADESWTVENWKFEDLRDPTIRRCKQRVRGPKA